MNTFKEENIQHTVDKVMAPNEWTKANIYDLNRRVALLQRTMDKVILALAGSWIVLLAVVLV